MPEPDEQINKADPKPEWEKKKESSSWCEWEEGDQETE